MKLHELQSRKGREKITMLTAYDYQTAKILDEAGVDLILVGDTLGMVVQGCTDTKNVTVEDMVYHTRVVARGAKKTPIIGDMPINSDKSPEDALRNARKLLAAGSHAVKIEGNKSEVINTLINNGVPVMGHLGLLPQTAASFRLKGKQPGEAEIIFQDALEIEKLGVFSIVLECIPEKLAKKITDTVSVPTIGIGGGKYCDGQVLVINDMLGLDPSFSPKYLKRYANLYQIIKEAVESYVHEVKTGKYPDEEHTYH